MDTEQFRQVIRQGFDEASEGYDKPAMRFFDHGAQQLVEQLSLLGHEKVLDAATGTGKVAIELAKRLPNGRVSACDLSVGMLKKALENASQAEQSNIEFICSDVNDIHLGPGSFEGLVSGFGVFFWEDMAHTLNQLLSFVKPGGFFAMTSFADGSFKPLSDLCLSRFESYGVKLPDSYTWERLDNTEKHADLMKQVGLGRVESQKRQVGYFLKDAQEWWDLVNYTGFRSFLNQLSDADKIRFKAEHLQEIADQSTAEGIFLNVEVISTTAYKE